MIRILLVSSDPSLGTDWYRATGPLSRLKDVEIVRPEGGVFSWVTLSNVDVVFYQRPVTQFDVQCLEVAKKYNKPILLDYDDFPFQLNEDNPVYDIWNRDDKKASIKSCLKLADIVMVSTPALKDGLLEEVPGLDIRVVPNAIDDELFSVEPSNHKREKTILMRGASSHGQDWFEYKDGILEILREHQDYTLSVFGFHPEWMRDIPDRQFKPYQFVSLPEYFDTLMQIRPELMIVPLSDNKFNRCKSAIAFYEGAVAGATVLAVDLPEFFKARTFNSPQELVRDARLLIRDPMFRDDLHKFQLNHIPVLSRVNLKRKSILEGLARSPKKYSPKDITLPKATDKEFFEYSLAHGHTQDDPRYEKIHNELANWLIETVNPKTVLEIGSGTGGTLVPLLNKGIMAYGIELNPYSVEYFNERHPMYAGQITLTDFTKEPIEVDVPGDLLISIEVFEHINQPEEWWTETLTDLSKKFRYFYFTSTPYTDPKAWSEYWGHINVRRTTSWIKLFEQSGWKFISNPKKLVNWDLLLQSKTIN